MSDLVPFDYGGLDAETRIVVQQRTGEIKTLLHRSAQDIKDIGQKLIEVKAKLGHGNFEDWLAAEFSMSDDTARNFMNVAKRLPEIPNGSVFDAKALYMLAAPSTPEAAREEALERAASGEKVTPGVAKAIVEAHKPQKVELPDLSKWQDRGDVSRNHHLFGKNCFYVFDRIAKKVYLQRFDRSLDAQASELALAVFRANRDELLKRIPGANTASCVENVRVILSGCGHYKILSEKLNGIDWRPQIERDKYYIYVHPKDIVYNVPFDSEAEAKAAFPGPDHAVKGSVLDEWPLPAVKTTEFIAPPEKARPAESSGWLPNMLYPVELGRKWIFDHPLTVKEAHDYCKIWYPLADAVPSHSLKARAVYEQNGWVIQPARGETEDSSGDEVMTTADMMGEAGGDEQPALITGLIKGKFYPVDRLHHTVFNDPMDHSEAESVVKYQRLYHDVFLSGRAINGHERFSGWMIAEANPRKAQPPQTPQIIIPQKFAAILIDPPWKYDVYSEDTGQGRSAEAHYSTMEAPDIAAMPVGDLAADDCALFMWATWPCIQQAFAVGTAWGFEYKTCAFTWAKVKKGMAANTYACLNDDSNWHMGMGFWTRANSEVCLLFTKGSPKRQNADVRQLIVAAVRKHSQKPDEQYERIERLVKGPYLELFAREKRDGWYSWGNEVASDITFAGIQAAK